MSRRHTLPFVLLLVILFAACGASAQKPPRPVVQAFTALTRHDVPAMARLLHANPTLTRTKNQYGETLLSQAVQWSFHDMAALLLRNGAAVNLRAANGETPLHWAVKYGDRPMAALLIRHGGRDLNSPAFDAIARGDFAGLDRLLREHPSLRDAAETPRPTPNGNGFVFALPDDGFRPLNAAVLWRRRDMVSLLLARGADVNGKGIGGDTPLHQAVRLCDRGMAGLLLSKGANVNAHNDVQMMEDAVISGRPAPGRQTPLHLAAAGCGPDMTALLLAHGADINAKDNEGATPLIDAVRAGKEATVTLLLDKGANVNAADARGETPLLEAASYGAHETLAPLLLAHGADPNIRDRDGQTPLTQAIHMGLVKIIPLLLARNVNLVAGIDRGMTVLNWAIGKNDSVLAERVIRQGAPVNGSLSSGTRDTPLLAACFAGATGIVKLLLAHGARPNVADEEGNTPLHAAVQADHEDIVPLLLAHGANTNVREKYGETPLYEAVYREETGMVKLLLAHGAKVHIADGHGVTPLVLARGRTQGDDDMKMIVRLLRQGRAAH